MSELFLTPAGGMLGPIAGVLGWILEQLANFLNLFGIQNTGLTIILFTFIVNALMIPLTIKQNKFSKLQSSMAPELSRIQKKYKGKKDEASLRKQQMETQAIYQKYGSNPMAGCLPMLITLPILFALYRVIYHIPAYVGIYYDEYLPAAKGMMQTSNFTGIFQDFITSNEIKFSQGLQAGVDTWTQHLNDGNVVLVQNNLVEALSQFNPKNWDALSAVPQFAGGVSNTIKEVASSVNQMNTFLGMSIMTQPGFTFPGIIVPIAAAGFQFLQTKMMPQPQTDPDNPTASTMKSMNNIMPIMSGVFCFILPLGVGLYWIAGSVFRIIQQFFVNKYFDRIPMEEIIRKNMEKQNKKRARKGLEPVKMEDLAKTKTSSIDIDTKVKSTKKTVTPSDYKRSDAEVKRGGIAGYANLLSKNSGEKGDK